MASAKESCTKSDEFRRKKLLDSMDLETMTPSLRTWLREHAFLKSELQIDAPRGIGCCFTHRASAASHCRLEQVPLCELSQNENANEIVVLHHDHISIALEPWVRCANAKYKASLCRSNSNGHTEQERKKQDRRPLYSATRHSRQRWPATNRRGQRAWKFDETCILRVTEPLGAPQMVLRVGQATFMTVRALEQINHHVFANYAGTPGVCCVG